MTLLWHFCCTTLIYSPELNLSLSVTPGGVPSAGRGLRVCCRPPPSMFSKQMWQKRMSRAVFQGRAWLRVFDRRYNDAPCCTPLELNFITEKNKQCGARIKVSFEMLSSNRAEGTDSSSQLQLREGAFVSCCISWDGEERRGSLLTLNISYRADKQV